MAEHEEEQTDTDSGGEPAESVRASADDISVPESGSDDIRASETSVQPDAEALSSTGAVAADDTTPAADDEAAHADDGDDGSDDADSDDDDADSDDDDADSDDDDADSDGDRIDTSTGGDAAAAVLNHDTEDRKGVLPIIASGEEPKEFWTPQPGETRVRWLVLLGAFLVFFPNLGGFGLWDPWETHYGAVTTNMVETYDWVSPWWGYKEQIGTEPRQGNFFFSKPIYIFWTEALMCNFFGRSEWSIRFPMALLAMMAVFFAYLALSRIWTRRVGLLGAGILATSPQFFMISRQAQTDMPFVGNMLISLCFLMLALFAKPVKRSDKSFWTWTWVTLVGVLAITLPQYKLLVTDLTLPKSPSVGVFHAVGYIVALALVVGWFAMSVRRDLKARGLTQGVKDKWLRRWLMVWFYVFCGLSFYSKGLLFLIPGAIILLYLIISVQWRMLLKVEIIRGILVVMLVSLPWYLAMFVKHHPAFYQRFFVHDHFNRLGSGVHQIDSGTFEHFIKWLGIGMFPWAIFVPFALIWMFRLNTRDRRPENQANIFVAVWFALTFTLFTLSSTKFHHYIFPAMPALAILTALFIDRLLTDKTWLPRFVTVIGVLFFAALCWDLHEDPQHVRNLMTYKYDRPMPEHLPIDPDAPVSNSKDAYTWEESTFWRHSTPLLKSVLTTEFFRYDTWIPFIAILGLLGLVLFFRRASRKWGLGVLALLSALFALWSLNYYMPSLSPHWSQKYLFDSYYDTCSLTENPDEVQEAYEPLLPESFATILGYRNKRVCKEDVISWLITWRGETYYSYNELQPITKEQPQFMPYLETRNGGEKFYALMERGKMSGFKTKLQRYSDKLKHKGQSGWSDIRRWDVKIENDESLYFQMVSATPVR